MSLPLRTARFWIDNLPTISGAPELIVSYDVNEPIDSVTWIAFICREFGLSPHLDGIDLARYDTIQNVVTLLNDLTGADIKVSP